MNQIPRISEAEWEVMKVLWASLVPMSANEVIDRLSEYTDWSPKTVRTLLTRLVQKNALELNQSGKVYTYVSLVDEEQCVRAETQSFLKRIYGGALKPMLVHYLKGEKLTKEDIEELKNILERGSE